MKRIVILFLAALFAASGASAQKFHNAYYDTRRAAHDEEGLQQGAIVFLGNSITEQGWWSLLLKRGDVENRGIGGDNTFGMIDRLPDILKSLSLIHIWLYLRRFVPEPGGDRQFSDDCG